MSRWVIEHVGGFSASELDSLENFHNFSSNDDSAVIVDLCSIAEFCEEVPEAESKLSNLPNRVFETLRSATENGVDYVHFTE